MDFADTSDPLNVSNDINDHSFAVDLPPMAYGLRDSYVEFEVTHSSENNYINFPVTVQFVKPDRNADNIVTRWITVHSEIIYLPIGPYAYYPFVSVDSDYPHPAEPITGTNTVWFNARICMKDHGKHWRWVDEAFLNPPRETPEIFSFQDNITAPVAWSVKDPRRNTWQENWTPPGPTPTLRKVNTPTLEFFSQSPSAGLPVYIPNAPFERIGDLGAISLGGATNDWQTIDLTTLEGAHLLDRLTLAPTNAPAYGRVHVGTRQRDVIRALLADVPIGFDHVADASLRSRPLFEADPAALDTLTDAWFEAQQQPELGLRYAELFHAFGNTQKFVDWEPDGFDPAISRDIKEQVLRGLVDRLSFRQNLFVIIGVGQSLSPARRVVGEHRMAALVVRDAYTGRWQRLRTFHLHE